MVLRVKKLLQQISSLMQKLLAGKLWFRINWRYRAPPSFSLDWVIHGYLAVGGLPQSQDQPLLAQAKIRVILSLCSPLEGRLPENIVNSFHCIRLAIPDSHYRESLQVAQLATAVNIVHKCIRGRLPLYVHCLAGVERAPIICIAYLCRFCDLELWEAIHLVKQVHPATLLSPAQIRVIQELLQRR